MSQNIAIFFNGAASYIAQEAAMLDLLMDKLDLNIKEDVTFIGGLSSGALMTFVTNAAFCNEPILTWDSFKEDILFPLTTDQIYTPGEKPYDTQPLQELLEGVSEQTGYRTLSNLPFDSAILTCVRFGGVCWLTNISDVGTELPSPPLPIYENIRVHQPNIDLVSSLMCSTAIPVTFPSQQLFYELNDPKNTKLPIKNFANEPACFVDGGTNGVFQQFDEFFGIYNNKFDAIYFISPNFATTAEEAYKLIDAENINSAAARISPEYILDYTTKEFIKKIKEYNKDQKLADVIYYCKPEDITGYDPLSFDEEEEQYKDTIEWGEHNPDKIAIDINKIDLGS